MTKTVTWFIAALVAISLASAAGHAAQRPAAAPDGTPNPGLHLIATQDVAKCLDSAYDTCKNRECNQRSRYCTGGPADIKRSPCYTQAAAQCAPPVSPQKAARCRDSAYDTCKNRECNRSSRYCTGRPADITRSPCYGQSYGRCVAN